MSTATWGYRPDGRAAIFDDGVLPEGWHDTPTVMPEEMRSAEALSARMERNPRPSLPPQGLGEKPARKPRKGS
jgi:hypothetical protein